MVDAGLLISIRAKLCKPGFFKVEVSCIMMLYYNDVFIINMIIFFMAMPSGLISSFGNWMYLSYWVLLMSFPRLNNLSYWLIPVPLMLILSACLLDSSCATSWTVYPPSSTNGHAGNRIDLAIFNFSLFRGEFYFFFGRRGMNFMATIKVGQFFLLLYFWF